MFILIFSKAILKTNLDIVDINTELIKYNLVDQELNWHELIISVFIYIITL